MQIFDLDGTLIDSNGVWVEVDLRFLGRLGLSPTREYSDLMGHALFPAAAQITKDYYHLALSPREIMDQWMDLARDAYLHHVPLKPGALAYLVRCQARGDRMVLFTSCVKELCQAALDRHGLAGYFDHLVFAEDLGAEKRDPAAFPRLLERLGVSAGECTLYEDSPGACAAARQAGLTVVGVADPFYGLYEAELRRTCHRFIHSFEELLG